MLWVVFMWAETVMMESEEEPHGMKGFNIEWAWRKDSTESPVQMYRMCLFFKDTAAFLLNFSTLLGQALSRISVSLRNEIFSTIRFFFRDSHGVKGWHLNKQLNSPSERDSLESWAPGRDTAEELSLHWLGFVASVRGFQILSSGVSLALQCMSQSPVDAKEVTAKKVNSKLGIVPGMELDSLILVPEPKDPGFARASLALS